MIEKANNGHDYEESWSEGWSFYWPTIDELGEFAKASGFAPEKTYTQIQVIGGKVRVVLRYKP